MNYFKKILILKQIQEGFSSGGKPVSGILRLEMESGVTTASLTMINLAPIDDGGYFLFINDRNGLLLSIELGKSPLSITKALPTCPELDKNLSVGVSFIKDGIPLLIAYANSENKSDVTYFKKQIIDKCIADKKYLDKAIVEEKSSIPPPTPPSERYDDEVVATENYYLLDDDFDSKLKKIERLDNELLRDENELSFKRDKEETKKNSDLFDAIEDATNTDSFQSYSKDSPYFEKVRGELDEIFKKFPEEQSLTNSLPHSKWAKIYYSENKFYVVGIVFDQKDKKEKYICYGVPDKYSLSPPKELKGFCTFIPLSVFDMTGDGYWMMFQSAITGECIKKPQA